VLKHAFILLLLSFYIIPLREGTLNPSRFPAAEDETKYGWKITFEDEFEGREAAVSRGVSARCFDMIPQCLVQYWTQKDCKSIYRTQLSNLNKCNWRVYDLYNWMDFDAPEGEGVNSLNPSQVEVKDGNLYLYASRSSVNSGSFNCKKKFFDHEAGMENYSKECPFISGGIQSKTHDNHGMDAGFAQEYGRFEVRAILPNGPGTWPAHWLLPDQEPDTNSSGQGCGWPFSGEIDIMEMWADQEGVKYKGGLITGDCERHIAGGEGGYGKSNTIATNFHRYSVEWTPNYVKLLFDDEVIKSIYKDQPIKSKYHETDGVNYSADELDDRFKHPARIPNHPFYWILNTTIDPSRDRKKKYKPDPENFKQTKHIIDYVRTYKRCTAEDDPKTCIKFKDKDVVYNYNSHKGETATFDINVFPSPQLKGRDMTMRVTANQYCEDVRMNLVNMAGQLVGVDIVSGSESGRDYLYKGVMTENETKEIVFRTNNLSAGLYLATAWFEKCGPGLSGQGNQVFKMVIVN
jgi:beta-glucanase (GH16 family)